MDKLGSIMRSKDHYRNEQLSGQQIEVSLRAADITHDREMVMRWMRAADVVGRGIYSIPVLLDIRVGFSRGTWEPGSQEILVLKRNIC